MILGVQYTPKPALLDLGVHKHTLDTDQVGLLPLDVDLQEDGPDIVRVQEGLHGVIGNGVHGVGLHGVVPTRQAVLLLAEEVYFGVVEVNLCTWTYSCRAP